MYACLALSMLFVVGMSVLGLWLRRPRLAMDLLDGEGEGRVARLRISGELGRCMGTTAAEDLVANVERLGAVDLIVDLELEGIDTGGLLWLEGLGLAWQRRTGSPAHVCGLGERLAVVALFRLQRVYESHPTFQEALAAALESMAEKTEEPQAKAA